MSYSRGEIVWVKFPFTDASTSKLRPALIISNSIVNKTGDYLLMQITTNIRRDNFSLAINNSDFLGQPLLKAGELRVHKIFIINESLIQGTITQVSNAFMEQVIDKLNQLLK